MKISVIIPIYNKEEYIETCLNKTLKQTFEDFEVIAVDDGSTDRSGQICDQLAEKDSRLKVIHIPNMGVTAARKRGLDEAKGQYVMFSDADDFYLPDALATLYNAIESSKADEVIASFVDQYGHYTLSDHIGEPPCDLLIREILANEQRFCVLWGIIFKKEILEDCLDIPNEIIEGEDKLMQIKVLAKQPRVRFIDDCVYMYNMGLPNDRKQTLERAIAYDNMLREILAYRWDFFEHHFILHQLKDYQLFVAAGEGMKVKPYYKEQFNGRLNGSFSLANRLTWWLPTNVAGAIIRTYWRFIRAWRHRA
ncbi:MAG: glycosyltransferase family 2 protein [Prevotella sp.]|nr:glycosyltransferase family 2 protein [Prevotella sp.]